MKTIYLNRCHDCGCSCECSHDCKGDPANCTCTSKIKCNYHCGCYLDVLALALREAKIPTGGKRNNNKND